jgi:hypothetical protein
MTFVGVVQVEPLDEIVNDVLIASTPKCFHIRLLAILVYIALSFTSQLNIDNTMISFSYISHLCFIVGGLSIESVLSNDRITTRLTEVLLVAELIAYAIWLAYHPSYDVIVINIFKVLVLLGALSKAPVSYESVLSFNIPKEFYSESQCGYT